MPLQSHPRSQNGNLGFRCQTIIADKLSCNSRIDGLVYRNIRAHIVSRLSRRSRIDLIKQKPSTVYQHVVNIAKETLCLLDFLSLASSKSSSCWPPNERIHAAALSHNECISSSDVEEPNDFISLYFPLALLTTTTLVEPERLCFLRTYMVQRYTFFACATQTTQ